MQVPLWSDGKRTLQLEQKEVKIKRRRLEAEKRGEKAEVVSREGGGAPGPAPARSHE